MKGSGFSWNYSLTANNSSLKDPSRSWQTTTMGHIWLSRRSNSGLQTPTTGVIKHPLGVQRVPVKESYSELRSKANLTCSLNQRRGVPLGTINSFGSKKPSGRSEIENGRLNQMEGCAGVLVNLGKFHDNPTNILRFWPWGQGQYLGKG